LTRARKLGLHPHGLFEHSDLQQIQLELLVAVYFLCLGQLNRYVSCRSIVSTNIDQQPATGHANSPTWLSTPPFL
jgi:hypothetical protein